MGIPRNNFKPPESGFLLTRGLFFSEKKSAQLQPGALATMLRRDSCYYQKMGRKSSIKDALARAKKWVIKSNNPRIIGVSMRIHELGHIVFFVSDLEKSAHFYEKILGFPLIGRQQGMAAFGTGRTHHELLLIEVSGKATPKTGPGFYHMGLKIGNTDKELKAAIAEMKKNKVEIVGFGDHHVTHSMYIKDPDGNEIELYVDVNDDWKKDPSKVLKPTRALELD